MGRRSTIGLGKGFAVEHDRRYSPESGEFDYIFLLTIDKGFFKEVEHCEDYIEIELDENSEFAQLLINALSQKAEIVIKNQITSNGLSASLIDKSEFKIQDLTEDGKTIKKLDTK